MLVNMTTINTDDASKGEKKKIEWLNKVFFSLFTKWHRQSLSWVASCTYTITWPKHYTAVVVAIYTPLPLLNLCKATSIAQQYHCLCTISIALLCPHLQKCYWCPAMLITSISNWLGGSICRTDTINIPLILTCSELKLWYLKATCDTFFFLLRNT